MSEDNKLHIRMLGEFSLEYNGNSVNDSTNRFKKIWSLLEYLITYRERTISQVELIDVLWEDDDLSSPINNLKTLVHRARTVLNDLNYKSGKEIIKFARGSYYWNNDLDFDIDAENFKDLVEQSRKSTDKAEKLDTLRNAIDLYKGPFLVKSAYETWAVPVNAYYQNLYTEAIEGIIAILKEDNRYEEIIEISEQAVSIDPYNEDFHYYFIESLTKCGKDQEALDYYEYVTSLFYKQLGLNVSEKITDLYKEIVNRIQSVEFDLNIIKESLKEDEYANGAFQCELGLFKSLAQIESRAMERTGISIHLALFSVIDKNNNDIKQHIINKYMKKLDDSIHLSLRRGDIYTRYSLTQYIVMLPSTNFENATMVAERIAKSFRKKIAKPDIDIKFMVSPLDPSTKDVL